jgi:hypothetical protein
MLIGICGFARAGKDTAAEVLNKGYGFNHVSFAQKMKECLGVIFGWSLEYIEHHKEEVDPYWGISPREALRTLGTEYGQYILCEKFPRFKELTGRLLWVNSLLKEINPREDFVISDVRFHHEVNAIRQLKGYILKIDRPDYPRDLGHPSEQDIMTIEADFCIVNDGTLVEYITKVDIWARELYDI